MAWSTPLTAVANTALTAAQWNASVRDNLLETAAAKSTGASGAYFVSGGTNVVVQRQMFDDIVDTSEGTTSTTFVALATPGPVVTVTTGALALINNTADITVSVGGQSGRMTFDVSGASSIAASDSRALRVTIASVAAAANIRASVQTQLAITPGSNIFTSLYRSSSGASTASFANRRMHVMSF